MEAAGLPWDGFRLRSSPQHGRGSAGSAAPGRGLEHSRQSRGEVRGSYTPTSAQPTTYLGGKPGRQSLETAAQLGANPSSLKHKSKGSLNSDLVQSQHPLPTALFIAPGPSCWGRHSSKRRHGPAQIPNAFFEFARARRTPTFITHHAGDDLRAVLQPPLLVSQGDGQNSPDGSSPSPSQGSLPAARQWIETTEFKFKKKKDHVKGSILFEGTQ